MLPEGLNPEEELSDNLSAPDIPPRSELVASMPGVSPEPSEDFFEIRLVTNKVPVRIDYAAMRAVRSVLRGKDSALGLLRGTKSLDAVTIEEFDLLSSEAMPNGLIDAKLTKLDQSVVGFFRTQSNGWAEIQDNDRLIARQCFKDKDAVFLLVKNPGHRPWSGELFDLAGGGQFLTKDGAHEFYFDEYLLKNGYSTAPAEYMEPEEEIEEPSGRSIGGAWLVVAALSVIALVGYGVTRWDAVKNDMETLAHSRAQAPSILELTVHRSGGDFAISWNRDAPALEQSVSSNIVVSDGQVTRTFHLNREQLTAGRALYTPLPYSPLSGDIRIRLEVEQDKRSQSESVLIPVSKEAFVNTDVISEYAGKLRSALGAEVASTDALPVGTSLPQPVAAAPTPAKGPVQLPSLSTLTPPAPVQAPPAPVAIVREFPKLAPAAQQALSSLTSDGKLLLSVRVAIDTAGNVTSASVLPVAANLDQAIQDAALEAARQWKYKPGTLDGKPVASESTITFTFQ